MATAESVGQKCDVIVIGAGLAGLTAAYHLTKTTPECKVLVLEAKDRIGGRTLSLEMKAANGNDYWDLGGQWVGSTQHHVMWLIKELGMESFLFDQYRPGKTLLQTSDSHRIRSYEGDVPPFSRPALLDFQKFQDKLNGLSNTINVEEPWNMSDVEKYDNMTLETFLKENTWTQDSRDMLDLLFQAIFGARPREQSALNAMFKTASAISIQHICGNRDGAAVESNIKGGAQKLSLNLVTKLNHSDILLSEPVVSIDQTDPENVKVRTLSGKEFHAKFVISAAPIKCTASFQYLPTPPVRRQCLVGHFHVGHYIKFIATYKKAFWQENGLSGELIITGRNCNSTDRGCGVGPIQHVADATSANGNPALVGFLGEQIDWGQIPFEDRKVAILNHLADFLGPEAKTPLDFMEKDWSLEHYIGGCPVSMMMPGAAKYWDAIRTPFGKIHWAGTETATNWNGYMSGAVQSGLRAAEEVASKINPRRSRGDLLDSLNKKVASHRKAPKQKGSILWSLSKLTVGVAVLGVFLTRVWMQLRQT